MTTPADQLSMRDKRAKFVELANKRVNRAIKDLDLIANLANKRNYQYDEEQARQIVRALQLHVETVKHSFLGTRSEKYKTFELKNEQ
jgi:hypothetical protein